MTLQYHFYAGYRLPSAWLFKILKNFCKVLYVYVYQFCIKERMSWSKRYVGMKTDFDKICAQVNLRIQE